MTQRTWFITGTSRGFGREWAAAALRRGDRVVGTARDTSANDDLVAEYPKTFQVLPLNVTDRAAVFAAVKTAHDYFGELDIVVNNAGYGHFGTIEEATEAEARDQIETNLFGALWATQAALPYLRERGSGHILQVSSIGGVTAFPTLGIYHASKWGLEGFSQALAQEVAGFGIHVTLIEPGGFATDWAGASAKRSQPIAAYDPVRTAVAAGRAGVPAGDPTASAAAVLHIVDAENPPLRSFLGAVPLHVVEADYASRLGTWRTWQSVAELAQG
ncbi:SDR family oxidoreductase [Streptomyces sp. NPDC059396]|uniref:SDR family oxidoreductase n=1 Tax=Streptomyces sp. NPDC059396 TaxID=3346819 RepID=UPI0036C8FB16